MREAIARGLDHARARTLTLNEFDDAELVRQHNPLMSPLVWDLAHVGQQEDLWLLRGGNAQRDGVLPAEVDRLYDAFEFRSRGPRQPCRCCPRSRRDGSSPKCAAVRSTSSTARTDLFPFVMVEQHEHQHVETMFATHQLRDGRAAARPRQRAAAIARRYRMMPCWSRPANSSWVSTPAMSRGLSTTSVRPPWSTFRRSASGAYRSPTPSGKRSSTTADITALSGGRLGAGPTESITI